MHDIPRRRILAALAAACLLLCGCTTRTAPVTLRVMSYNIHHGEGTDGVFDLERIAAVIEAQDPDLVALQEVDRGTNRASGVDQAAVLSRLTGMHHAYGAAMAYDGGEYGEAILSRRPIAGEATLVMPKIEGSEPRALLSVRVRIAPSDEEIVFSGTHLAHDSAVDRLDQAARIRDILTRERLAGHTVILAGDLNAAPGSAPMHELLQGGGFIDVFADKPGPTYPSGDPQTRIDWILVHPAAHRSIEVLRTEVIDDALASDHCALLAIVRILDTR